MEVHGTRQGLTPKSTVISTPIKHETVFGVSNFSSAAVVGWKFMERDKASGLRRAPQEFQAALFRRTIEATRVTMILAGVKRCSPEVSTCSHLLPSLWRHWPNLRFSAPYYKFVAVCQEGFESSLAVPQLPAQVAQYSFPFQGTGW
jgi:hypothetical protein